jgi:hypothetical protein
MAALIEASQQNACTAYSFLTPITAQMVAGVRLFRYAQTGPASSLFLFLPPLYESRVLFTSATWLRRIGMNTWWALYGFSLRLR